ncbi:MAG: lysophospholipid acyltransferase family protein [Terrimicrobiaceae bacterium]
MTSGTTLRHRVEFLGLQLSCKFVAGLPFGFIRPLANMAGAMGWAFDARGKKVALANLESAFGTSLSPERRIQIGRASYQSFARTMLELAWAPNLNREVIEKWVDFEGIGDSPCNTDPSRPAIYATMHYSNFEWVGLAGAYGICQMPLVAQQFKNPLIGPIFDKLRSSTGHPIIPRERAMLRMLKNLRDGGKFGFLADLSLDPKLGSTVVTQFGGLQTSITQMHAALALKTGASIVPLECRPIAGGRYRIVWHPEIAFTKDTPVQEITQRTWDVLETVIRKNPEYWLWPYKHWRFKPSHGDTSRYPFYANPAKRFDQLLTSS